MANKILPNNLRIIEVLFLRKINTVLKEIGFTCLLCFAIHLLKIYSDLVSILHAILLLLGSAILQHLRLLYASIIFRKERSKQNSSDHVRMILRMYFY